MKWVLFDRGNLFSSVFCLHSMTLRFMNSALYPVQIFRLSRFHWYTKNYVFRLIVLSAFSWQSCGGLRCSAVVCSFQAYHCNVIPVRWCVLFLSWLLLAMSLAWSLFFSQLPCFLLTCSVNSMNIANGVLFKDRWHDGPNAVWGGGFCVHPGDVRALPTSAPDQHACLELGLFS